MAATSPQHGSDLCHVCGYPHVDVRLTGCGCSFHVTCVPASLICNPPREESNGTSGPCFQCSFCQGSYTGLYVEPLSFEEIDLAISLRKEESKSSSSSSSDGTPVVVSSSNGATKATTSKNENSDHEEHIRAAAAVYSQVKPVLSSGVRADESSGRTGRWTEAEVGFVDHVVTLFDQGELPLPNGTKLGNFLGDILLCRTSRLTKKMKKAKLGARTFTLKSQNGGQFSSPKDHEFFSMIQEGFIRSMPEEYTQVEVRFNLARQWRSYFLELCLQAGYSRVQAEDWIVSLDKFDELASAAKEQTRAFERRMIQRSFNNSNDSSSQVFSSTPSIAKTTVDSKSYGVVSCQPIAATQKRLLQKEDTQVGLDIDDLVEPKSKRPRSGSEDLDTLIRFMECDTSDDAIVDEVVPGKEDSTDAEEVTEVINSVPKSLATKPPSTFSDAVASFMETNNLPFDYADVWVPACVQQGNIRLLPAGHATRRDQVCASALENFGEYSQQFSFDVGSGLPGRVYTAQETRWEFKICDSDPCFFMRAQGAKTCGIKTAVGIPFSTSGLGKMIVVFYSRQELPADSSLAELCWTGLTQYSPKPKWQLVIEKGNNQVEKKPAMPQKEEWPTSFSSFFGSLLPPTATNQSPSLTDTTAASEQNASDVTDAVAVRDIVSLLSDELSANPSSGDDLMSQMLQLRLFLLRPVSRMSHEDMGMVSIISSSFEHYSKDSRRSHSAIAKLLTQEWAALRATNLQNAAPSPETYRRHILDPRMDRTLLSSSKGLRLPALTRAAAPQSKSCDSAVLVYKHAKMSKFIGPLEPSRRTVSFQSLTGSSQNSLTNAAPAPSVASLTREVSPVPAQTFPFEVFTLNALLEQKS